MTDDIQATLRAQAEPAKQDDGFLRGVVSSTTSYSEGWRDVCARLLWAEEQIERLQQELSDIDGALAAAEAPREYRRYQRITLLQEQIERLTAGGLSLSITDDPLAVSDLLDDSTREREMYHRLIAEIRALLPEKGLHVQLLDIPKAVEAQLRARAASERKEGAS